MGLIQVETAEKLGSFGATVAKGLKDKGGSEKLKSVVKEMGCDSDEGDSGFLLFFV